MLELKHKWSCKLEINSSVLFKNWKDCCNCKKLIFCASKLKILTAAKAIADKLSSEIIEIKDLKCRKRFIGYIKAALDARGMKTTSIEPNTANTADYDLICLGTPIWAGKPAPAINTIMKNEEIKGKDVICNPRRK